MAKFSGHAVIFRSSAYSLWRRLDTGIHLDPHLIWQATESYVERRDAFGLVPHKHDRGHKFVPQSYNLQLSGTAQRHRREHWVSADEYR
jgi:hypothetical protein